MLVLRITSGLTSQEVRTASTDAILGSDPTADITLQQLGLSSRALRLVHKDTEVQVEMLDDGRTLTMRVGDEVRVGSVDIALVGLLPAESPPPLLFGGYDDDPTIATARPFELDDSSSPAPIPLDAPAAATAALTPTPTPTPMPTPTPKPTTPDPRVVSASLTPGAAPRRDAPAEPARKRKKRLTPEEKAAALKAVKFEEPTFGAALVVQLKRSPFFALSLAFHALLFLALTLLDTTATEKPLRLGPGAIIASMTAEDEELGAEVDDLEDDGLPLMAEPLEELPELLPEDRQPPKPDAAPPPSPFPNESLLPDDQPDPVDIGLMPGLRAASSRVRRRKPKMPKVDLKKTFTKGGAGSSNQSSANIVRAALGRGRAGNGATLDDLEPDDILVVGGSFDHIEKVLDALRIKYVKKNPWGLFAPKLEDFSSYKLVFWNCGESIGRQRITTLGKRLKKFVRDGGYLFTTDWGVANVIVPAFPGYLKTNGNRAHLPEMVLPIQPNRSARDHPLLEGVFHKSVQGKWWLEQASFDVAVGKKDAVTVLIESPMLRDTFNRSPAVAVTFHHGRGRVLHTMGHYYQEAGNLAGTLSAHRLALNFVLMRLDQDRGDKR